MRKDKTLSFFDQRRPDAVEHLMPIVPAAPNRPEIGELCWGYIEGLTTWDDFAKAHVQSSSSDAAFFLDSSFLHRREIPYALFDALMSKKIVITPLIWAEMQDWIAKPFANVSFRDMIVDARDRGSSSVIFLDQEEWPQDIRETIHYYVSLLLARKHVGLHLKVEYTNKYGNEPSPDELASMIQTRVGDRGVILAKKGIEDHAKPNFSADEDLVVTAVTYAILNEQQTTILTRDRDPLEQFRKFIYLLDTHYRALLVADSFIDTPENLIEHVDTTKTPEVCFEETDKIALNLPRRYTEWVLPRNSTSTMVNCHRLAGDGNRMKIASLQFPVHCEMLQLLKIKGKTGGRNCTFPDGRN